jgi:hypothetical protein
LGEVVGKKGEQGGMHVLENAQMTVVRQVIRRENAAETGQGWEPVILIDDVVNHHQWVGVNEVPNERGCLEEWANARCPS